MLAPASHRQELFLNSTADITLGGGAKGGGIVHFLVNCIEIYAALETKTNKARIPQNF